MCTLGKTHIAFSMFLILGPNLWLVRSSSIIRQQQVRIPIIIIFTIIRSIAGRMSHLGSLKNNVCSWGLIWVRLWDFQSRCIYDKKYYDGSIRKKIWQVIPMFNVGILGLAKKHYIKITKNISIEFRPNKILSNILNEILQYLKEV